MFRRRDKEKLPSHSFPAKLNYLILLSSDMNLQALSFAARARVITRMIKSPLSLSLSPPIP